mmetsp:Transcript_8356/g.12119  ORF Transcript_8356/g.12119 Transcript_8356/m.12119 type:complete len:112 (-) Transcript_8356:479-814(-)
MNNANSVIGNSGETPLRKIVLLLSFAYKTRARLPCRVSICGRKCQKILRRYIQQQSREVPVGTTIPAGNMMCSMYLPPPYQEVLYLPGTGSSDMDEYLVNFCLKKVLLFKL